MTIGVGVIGYGYWGPNLVRNFMETPGLAVRTISDLDADRRALAQARCPMAAITADHRDLFADSSIDAIAVATPVTSHYELASQALRAGKHVMVEKPMTATTDEAERLLDEAAAAQRILMVDHTFVYTGAVQKIKEIVASGALGDVLYYDSVRVNLGLFQHDVNVIWDLAVHDFSIIENLLPQRPTAVTALGVSHVAGQPENIAYVTLLFDGSLIAHLHVNWLAPVKIRRTLIGGNQKMIVYDDLEPSEKVKVYDRGVQFTRAPDQVYQLRVGYRSGDMYAPKVALAEALKVEAEHFAECIEHGTRPLTDGEAGLRVVQMLEAASASMAEQGRLVRL